MVWLLAADCRLPLQLQDKLTEQAGLHCPGHQSRSLTTCSLTYVRSMPSIDLKYSAGAKSREEPEGY